MLVTNGLVHAECPKLGDDNIDAILNNHETQLPKIALTLREECDSYKYMSHRILLEDSKWIVFSIRFRQYTDAGLSTDLDFLLSAALASNPSTVLDYLPEKKLPEICFDRSIETSLEQSVEYSEIRLRALENLKSRPTLAKKLEICRSSFQAGLERVKRGKSNLLAHE